MDSVVTCRSCGWSAELEGAFPNGVAKCPACGGQKLDSGKRPEPRLIDVYSEDAIATLVGAMYAKLGEVPSSQERMDWAQDSLTDLELTDGAVLLLSTALCDQMQRYEREHIHELNELTDPPSSRCDAQEEWRMQVYRTGEAV